MPSENKPLNDWTIMFFFASDMELSALTVSQIKAVKDAGYQKSTEVLLYFDSNARGVPTRLFNMNKGRKGGDPPTRIGDGKDPYIRSFLYDEILPKDMDPGKGECTKALHDTLTKPDTDSMHATDALKNFMGYCQENSPAKHYLLFLVGHGMVVANDTFLYDENPRSAITLTDLGKLLKGFTTNIKGTGTLELLGLHSCSTSSIEVAYELKDTAKYMIASQGYSYVGSWPYRQLLKKIFNTTEEDPQLQAATVQTLIQKIYELSLYNAPDFAYCGYSHDLTLCSLDGEKIQSLVKHLVTLTSTMKKSLSNPRCQQLILLAHWKSQAFWRDEYTDIYDFCRCLDEICDINDPSEKELKSACQAVIGEVSLRPNPFDGLVVLSDNFGWESQFAHGLSIYFPWIRPLGDEAPLNNYQKYAFTKDLGRENSWFSFLEKYWDDTKRAPENQELSRDNALEPIIEKPSSSVFGFLSSSRAAGENKPGGGYNKPGASMAESPCICPSFKNFPTTVKLGRREVKVPSMTRGVEKAFDPTDERSRSQREEE